MQNNMKNRRKATRLQKFHLTTLSIVQPQDHHLKKNNLYYYIEDISINGAKFHANCLFPLNAILNMDVKLDQMTQRINITGKVKWTKTLINDALYEAGVEFIAMHGNEANLLENYIVHKQNRTMLYWAA